MNRVLLLVGAVVATALATAGVSTAAETKVGDRHRIQVHLGTQNWAAVRGVIGGHFLGLPALAALSSLAFIDSRKR